MMGYRKGSAGSEYGWIRSISLIAFETYIIDESAICFCIGIAQQWGYAKSNENVILPIPFANETWKIASMSTTKSYDYTPTVVSKTNRSFEPGVWGLPYDYIAIGFQQWGYIDSKTGGTKLDFPIAFSNSTYSIVGSAYDSLSIYCAKFSDKTPSDCTFYNGIGNLSYNGDSDLNWIAIGKQQWGVVTDDRSTLTFLLPFSNSDYFYAAFPTNKVNTGGINLHGVRNPTYLELYSSISNNSNTANNWQFSGRNINPCWLAVGIQQWGNKQYSSWQSTRFDYPISMTTVYTALASRQLKDSDKTEFGCTILTTGSQFLTFMGYFGTANIVVLGR